MAKLPTMTEIRKMNFEDLRSEVVSVRRDAAKVRLGVELQKEKDTAQMKRLRRHLARLLLVLHEKSSTNSKNSTSSKSMSLKSLNSSNSLNSPEDDKKKPKSLLKKRKASTLPAHA